MALAQVNAGQTAPAQANTGPSMTLYPDLGNWAYPPTSPIPLLVGPPNMGNLQYQPGWIQPTGYRYPQYPVSATLSYSTGNYVPHTSAYRGCPQTEPGTIK